MLTPQMLESSNRRDSRRLLLAYCLEPKTLLLSARVALVVGTILGIINHGQAIVTGHFTLDHLPPLLLTYCVPFSVSLYSQIQGKRQSDRLYAELAHSRQQAAPQTTGNEQPAEAKTLP